jgi:hypothetical protein
VGRGPWVVLEHWLCGSGSLFVCGTEQLVRGNGSRPVRCTRSVAVW